LLGEEWSNAGGRIETGELSRLCVPAEQGGYRLGECPPQVLAVTRAIDVQTDRVYVEDVGWGARGIDCWLVNRMEVPRVKGRDMLELDTLPGQVGLPRAYKQLGTGKSIPVVAEAIDSGHFTDETYRAVRRRSASGIRCYAVKGSSADGRMAGPWNPTRIDRWPDGTPMPGGLSLLNVNTSYWKTAISGRIAGMPDAEPDEETESAAGQVPGFYLPENKDGQLDDYLRQMTSEERRIDRGKRGEKYPKMVWALRPGQTQNHYFDCRVYNSALADWQGVRRLTAIPVAAQPAAAKPKQEQREKPAEFGGKRNLPKPPWAK